MAGDLGENQCRILQDLAVYVESIQNLLKYHGQQERSLKLQRQPCADNECLNSAAISAIASHVDSICKIINDGKNNLLTPSLQNPDPGQTDDPQADSSDSDPCEKALNNSVVLRSIMKHLDAPNLLSIRSIAKIWETEATSQLLTSPRHNKFYGVFFLWDEEELQFQNTAGTLQEFTELFCVVNPLGKFPCSQFEFLDIMPMGEENSQEVPPDLSNFLSRHGHLIKSLKLSWNDSTFPVLKIIRSIFGWTPSLHSLTLDVPFYGRPAIEISDVQNKSVGISKLFSFPLGDLRTLNFERPNAFDQTEPAQCKSLVRDILFAAPLLNCISNPCLWLTEEIVAAGKMDAVDSLQLGNFLNFPVILHVLDSFSRAGPQLRSLEMGRGCFPTQFSSPDPNFLQSLQRILESSRRTLSTCLLHGRLDLEMDIPTMENLEELEFVRWSDFPGGRGRMLPPGFSIETSFPKLKTLTIQGMRRGGNAVVDEDTDNPFEIPANSSVTIETLKIMPSSFFHPLWINQSRVSYPNVRILHLHLDKSWSGLAVLCTAIWESWTNSLLEELHFQLTNTQYDESNQNLDEKMDTVLTGFDVETCRMLRKRKDSQVQEEDFERGSSILNMNKLKLLQITGHQIRSGFPLFSRVAVIHALDPLRKRQNFRVVINDIELEDMILERNVDFWGLLPEYLTDE